jgi:hypothetical protein
MSQGTTDHNHWYFKSDPFAAGPIVATVDPTTKRVLQLKCSEDGAAGFTLK